MSTDRAALSPAPSPEAPSDTAPETRAGRALTDAVMITLQLHGRFMEVGQEMAAAGGLTAAWWQVLGGVLDGPRSVAEIGRLMGMSRQGVQRVADLLVDRGLAEYRPNPAHRRAKLLRCTDEGYGAIRRIAAVQHPWADRIGARAGVAELEAAVATLRGLVTVLDSDATHRDTARS